jgi:predicted flap endonuclease-1-like 5' DNA nuclease
MPDFELLLPDLITATIFVLASALVTFLLCRWRERHQDRGNASHFGDSDSFEVQQKMMRLTAEIADYEERDGNALTRIQDLEQEIAATDKRQQETLQEVTRAKRTLANTTAALETAKHERDQLAQEMQTLQKEHEVLAAREENLHGSEKKVLELTEALRESEYQVSRLGTEIQLINTIQTEFEGLRTDNRDLEEDLDRLRKDNGSLETHVNRLTADAHAERQQRRQTERELNEVRATMATLQASPPDSAPIGLVADAPTDPNNDALTAIEGIPAGIEAKLNDIGITHWAQIAAWTEDDVSNYSDQLGFQDRIQRDRWVEQARTLSGSDAVSTPSQESDSTAGTSDEEKKPDEEIDQFTLFASEPIEDPVSLSESPSDGELLLEDPSLGHVFRRPPSIIDDLTRIKGVARVIEGRLHEIGIFRFKQIADWTDSNVEAFSKRLSFKERIQRDQWISQCENLHREKYGSS